MIFQDIDESKLDEYINKDLVLLDFYAEWCGPCKMLLPVLEELSKIKNIDIYKVNVDKHTNLARQYGVMTIPTIVLYKNGLLIKKNIGYISLDNMLKWIDA